GGKGDQPGGGDGGDGGGTADGDGEPPDSDREPGVGGRQPGDGAVHGGLLATTVLTSAASPGRPVRTVEPLTAGLTSCRQRLESLVPCQGGPGPGAQGGGAEQVPGGVGLQEAVRCAAGALGAAQPPAGRPGGRLGHRGPGGGPPGPGPAGPGGPR